MSGVTLLLVQTVGKVKMAPSPFTTLPQTVAVGKVKMAPSPFTTLPQFVDICVFYSIVLDFLLNFLLNLN